MKHQNTPYKGYIISKRIDTKNNTCLVYKLGKIAKCIVGDIDNKNNENSIEKAKTWINEQTK